MMTAVTTPPGSGTVTFGGDVLTFDSYAADTANALPGSMGTYDLVPTAATVPGCRHRPFREATRGGAGAARAEYPEVGVGIGTNWWQTTCPPTPIALAAKASDLITVNGGLQYRILGDARPFYENGRLVKVTFLSERQTVIA